MSAARKTVDVQSLKEIANEMLKNSYLSKQQRQGVALMMEYVLLRAQDYRGFVYLQAHEVPYAEEPGVEFSDGMAKTRDEYRRIYL